MAIAKATTAQNLITLQDGQNTEITATAGQQIAVAGDAAVQGMAMNGTGGLVIQFDNGASLTIANFAQVSSLSPAPTLALPGGRAIVLSEFQPTQAAPAQDSSAPTQTAHLVDAPAAGEDVVLNLEKGETYKFNFDIAQTQSIQNIDGQLVISFDAGGKIIVPNYGASGNGGEVTFKGGQVLSGVPVTRGPGVADTRAAQQLAEIEPAAGEAQGGANDAGGARFQSTFTADSLNSLAKIGPINETALNYRAPDRTIEPVLTQDDPAPIQLSLETGNKWVKEDGSVALEIYATPQKADHQITLTVTGFDANWGVDTAASGGTYDAATGTWTITLAPGASYTGLGPAVIPPAQDDADMPGLTVTLDVLEVGTGRTASTSVGIDVYTDAVVDPVTLNAAGGSGPEDTEVPLSISITPSADTDSSEEIASIVISGVRPGFMLNKGVYDAATDTWTLQESDLAGLTLKGPANYKGTETLTVTVVNEDKNLSGLENDYTDNVFTTSKDIDVVFTPQADALTIRAFDEFIDEDGSVNLRVEARLTDVSETLTVSISGFDASWDVDTAASGGTYDAATGTWTITLAPGNDFSGGPKVKPPADSDVDMTGLVATATSTDGTSTASASAVFNVYVDAVIDAPALGAGDVTGAEDSAIPLDITLTPGGDNADGSESYTSITIAGVPAGGSLSAGTYNAATGEWELSAGDLAGLALTPPPNFNGDIALTVRVVEYDTPTDYEDDTTDNEAVRTAGFTVTVTPEAETPSVKADDVWVKEDGSEQLVIEAALDPSGPSTDVLTVTVSGIDPLWGVDITASGGTYDKDAGTWTITMPPGEDFAGGPVFSPPADSDLDLTGLVVTATQTDPLTGDIGTATTTASIFVDAVIDGPTLDADNATGLEDAAIPLTVSVTPGGDADGSETLGKVVIITGAPAGSSFNKGAPGTAPGTWEVDAGDLAGLAITPPKDYTGSFSLTFSVTESENVTLATPGNAEKTLADNTATATDTITVTVNPDADAPTIKAFDKWVKEDGSVQLHVEARLTDASETLTVEVSGIGPGWGVDTTASGGVYDAATGTWTLTLAPGQDFTGGPSLSPPADSDADLTGLAATAISTAPGTGAQKSATATFNVHVDAVIDGPDLSAKDTGGSDNGPIAPDITLDRGGDDADGSETVTSLTISGVPAGARLNHGKYNDATGNWDLSEGDLAGLELTPPRGFDGVIKLTVKVVETETNLSGLEDDYDDNTATDTVTLEVTVTDDNPLVVDPAKLTVDETDLPLPGPLAVSGHVNANYFSDAPGAIGLTPGPVADFSASGSLAGGTLTSGGAAVTVSRSGNTYTGTANGAEVFTLTVQENGDYTFTLKGVLDHANPADPNDAIFLDFGVTATDADGDTADGTIRIRVLDDGPKAFDDHNTFLADAGSTDGNVITGHNGGPGAADTLGQDDTSGAAGLQNTVTTVTYNGTDYDLTATGSATVVTDNGTLVISTDGSYTYTLKPGATGLTTAALNPSASDVAGSQTSFTKNGITVSSKPPLGSEVSGPGDLKWHDAGHGAGVGIGSNGSADNKVWPRGEILNVDPGQPAQSVTLTLADIGDNNAGHPLTLKVYLQDGTTATVTENVPDPAPASGLWNITLTSADFGGKAIDSIDLYNKPGDDSVSFMLNNAKAVYGSDADTHDVFHYTLADYDGDTSTATLTLEGLAPKFIVGRNVDDTAASTTGYQVGTGTGTITGGAAGDVLVGDVGGASTETQAKAYNIVLVLDISTSMAGTKIATLKTAVNNLLESFHDYAGGEVKVHLIPFSDSAQTGRTFTLTGAGGDEGYADAVSFVNGLNANGYTNYEHPLQKAIDWLESGAPITGAETYTYFVSDGSPNRYVNGSNTSAGSGMSGSAEERAMDEIQGIGESGANDGDGAKNEVTRLKELSTDVISVGIGVNSATLARLDIIDKDGDAVNVDVEDLDGTLQAASPLNRLSGVGGDEIVAGAGDDIVFGDALNTDALAAAHGLSAKPGSGWAVFEALESGQSAHDPAWSRADTIEYIKAHGAELAAESLDSEGKPRTGGDDIIDGGAGADRIFGQEGDDIIAGGLGDDILSGGSGADTFVLNGVGEGVDTITDFNAAEGDVLDIQNIISGTDPLADIHDYVNVFGDGNGNTVVQIDPTGGGSGYQTVAVLEGVSVDIDTLVGGSNIVA